MAGWTPATTGTDYELTPILSPLVDAQTGRDLKGEVLVISGLSNKPARPEGPGDHAAGTAGFLTCTHIRKSETDIQNAISFDQVVAAAIGSTTPLGSLQLGIEGGSNVGNCDSGYGCAYSRNISWADATRPLPKLTVPKLAFDLIFGGLDPDASEAELARRKAYRLSVLDYVNGEAKSLQQRLGASDRAKLDEYLTGVRELEERIKQDESLSCDISGFDPAYGDFREHVDTMTDLMVLALECQATSVITFMLGNAASGRSYDFLGVPGAHHDISHHGSEPDNLAALQTIDTWEVEQFTRLLERMAAVQEGDSTLLDNSLVMFSSEIEDGNSHSHDNLPVLVAGRGGGNMTPGRHLVYDGEPIADLLIRMGQAFGANLATFGDDGTRPLDGLD